MARVRKAVSTLFDAITVEGSLISSAVLARIAARDAGGQSEADYDVPKGLTLRDEIARFFRIGQALFTDLFASSTPSRVATIAFTDALMRDVFGFSDVRRVGSRAQGERQFNVTLEARGTRVPIVVVPPSDDLDHASPHLATEGRRRSAASSAQDWLNHNDSALWGFCTNGERLRLVRDNASLTRPAYVEGNLRQIFEGEDFADFAAFWLLIHASRFGAAGALVSDCALERWREAGANEGQVARERLRDGVKAALLALGNGFLSNADNGSLRGRIAAGELTVLDFFRQLLRLVYRLIFLLAAEDRGLIHPIGTATTVCRLYADGYSLSALRDRAVRRSAWDQHHDRWEGLLITFMALAQGQERLGLPALGGLFGEDVMPDLERACLSNRSLMEAVYRLAWLKDSTSVIPVNWRDMETEELGSVYESLLELTPCLVDHGRGFAFVQGPEAKGNERKTTGSYYTPDSLVQTLLDSALNPVLDRIEAEADDAAQALLRVTVIDPACGSGHFLLAAARRIATRVGRARTGGVASAQDYRHALRDVVRTCIHGVDRNPMAVELTKVALWIETVEPGKPLGFLDANILCGDSLLGLFDLETLRHGVPDAAYKALVGDDKDAARYFDKRNKAERQGQGALDFAGGRSDLPAPPPLARAVRTLRALPEENALDIAEKRRRFEGAKADRQWWTWRVASDLYVGAFLSPKNIVPQEQSTVTVPTTDHVWRVLAGGQAYGPLVGSAQEFALKARAFHWPLEFPDIMAAGGFDAVLGNPPWERIKVQEQEFFAAREPEISQAPNASARGQKIALLKEAASGSRERALYDEFETAKRIAEAASVFARESGRFPLTGRGDVNTYALFAELFGNLVNSRGRAGVIVPTGIAFDDTTRHFFKNLVDNHRLISLFSFYEVRRWFKATDDRKPFCLLTMGSGRGEAEFAFDLRALAELSLRDRRFTLSAEAIAHINPNTKTAAVFRARADADLTSKIYANVPILLDENRGAEGNPWGLSFFAMFHMANDSPLFRTAAQLRQTDYERQGSDWISPSFGESKEQPDRYTPLLEAKMLHHFDHRWNTFDGLDERPVKTTEKIDSSFEAVPRYWVPQREVDNRLAAKNWPHAWLLGWRDIVGSEGRTLIVNLCPRMGVGDKFLLVLPVQPVQLVAALYGCLASLPCDYAAKQKVGGSSLKNFVFKQLPVLPPSAYAKRDLGFIVPRVLELTYTSQSMSRFANDLGYAGGPFTWNEDRRALLRSELDAWYAHAYRITRDELRYILEPTDVMGPGYPSETFRVLKNNEVKRFGEYRTRRLVLDAWDRIERGEFLDDSAEVEAQVIAPVDPATLPNGAWASGTDNAYASLAQLAALVKALPGPMPIARVRLAALYALEPRYLTRRLSGTDRTTWRRLVGPTSEIPAGTNVAAFAPRIDANWQSAVTQLRGMGAIIEDLTAQTWAPGARIQEFHTETWPDGRAAFVVRVLAGMSLDEATAGLSSEDVEWVRAYAA
jgi:hypothetical protein